MLIELQSAEEFGLLGAEYVRFPRLRYGHTTNKVPSTCRNSTNPRPS
jgi:hypothetical protein